MIILLSVIVLLIVVDLRVRAVTKRDAERIERLMRANDRQRQEIEQADGLLAAERKRICKALGIPHYFAMPARIKGLLELERCTPLGKKVHYLDADQSIYNGETKIGTLITNGDGTVTVRVPDVFDDYEKDIDVEDDHS